MSRIIGLLLGTVVFAAAGEVCNGIEDGDQNQVDYSIRLRHLKGVAVDADGTPIPGVCVAIFTDADHQLISSAQTDCDGRFQLPKIRNGDYRLIAEYDSFGVANARVIMSITGSSSAIVKMQPRGIDSTSYIVARRAK